MSWFPIRSLRTKLGLFALLLVVVPGLSLSLLALASARGALEVTAGRQLAQLAGSVRTDLEQAIEDAQKTVTGWAQQDVMRDVVIGDLDKRVSRFLQTLREGGAPYRELYAVDRSGRVVAASAPELLDAPHNVDAAARTALGGTVAARGPTRGISGGALLVEIAAPIVDTEHGNAVIGGLVARYDWRDAIARVRRIRNELTPHGISVDIVIVDRAAGMQGASWRDEATEVERERLRRTALRLMRAESSPHGFRRAGGALVGWAGRPDGSGPVALVLEPLAVAFAPVERLERRLAITLAGVLIAAVAVATLLGARMSRPLRELTRATEEILQPGRKPGLVAVRSADEIGRLAGAFNAMSGALVRAQDDLLAAAKFAFVGEVAAGIAHEVRTPLGIMRSSAQLLARSVPREAEESVELAQMIVGEVDRIDRVVTGLLELSRPRQPSFETAGLAPLLRRALEFAAGQARDKGLVVSSEFPPAPPARCDPEQIYQVALNLIVNAIQVLPAGGHLTVRTLPTTDGRVGFEVADDGPGIPAEHRERVFTPFFSSRPGGTGLGLALVQRIVQAHHGIVTLSSEIACGTTFRILLPVAGTEA
jgi:signal transduction histidine kinase